MASVFQTIEHHASCVSQNQSPEVKQFTPVFLQHDQCDTACALPLLCVQLTCHRFLIPEKYAQVQQNPVLPPAPFFLGCKNSEEVSDLDDVPPSESTRTWFCRAELIFLHFFFRDRLSASDMLQVRKVMEHVYEKIINLDNESQTTSSSANDKPGEQEKEEDMALLAEEKIELMCQDQVGTPSLLPHRVHPQ